MTERKTVGRLTTRCQKLVPWLSVLSLTACGSSGSAEEPSSDDDSDSNTWEAEGVGGNGQLDHTAGASTTLAGTGSTSDDDADIDGSGGTAPQDDDVAEPDNDPLTLLDGVPSTSQLVRLSHAEYDRALSDLLYWELTPSSSFPSELASLDGYYDVAALRVTEQLHTEFVRVAEEVAAELIAIPSAYEQVVGCTPSEAECRDTFLQSFGQRAYRRPLTESELADYQRLFDAGAELLQSGDGFADGVQLSVEAMLQSPNFLYRVERGATETDDAGRLLTDYEIATRLSFTLLGTTPDDELLADAASGALSTPEQIAAQAKRLVGLPQVAERVVDFHNRWLHLESLIAVNKDQATFPNFTPDLLNAMQAETLRFVEEVTLGGEGAVQELLTANYTFVDDQLATLYGLPGAFGAELQKAELTDGPRSGLLTQGSFLVAHTSSSTITSPILRGTFVLRRLLCQDIPEPPPNATQQEPPPSETPIVTTREFFAWKTSMPACAGCHLKINPVGFAFEGFDAIGVSRTTEASAPVDTTGTVELGEQTLTFVDAKDLSAQLATSPELHACYAKNWLRYAYGRSETPEDGRTVATIAEHLATGGYGVRDLLVDLTRSAAFSHLAGASPNE